MKKVYKQPLLRAIYIDTQNLIAESLDTTDEEVIVDENDDIVSLSREDSGWGSDWDW